MKAGAERVLACDIDPFCRAAIALNAEVNGVRIDSVIADLLDRPPPAVALILAGDICYEKPVAERALAWLKMAYAAGARVRRSAIRAVHLLPRNGAWCSWPEYAGADHPRA